VGLVKGGLRVGREKILRCDESGGRGEGRLTGNSNKKQVKSMERERRAN